MIEALAAFAILQTHDISPTVIVQKDAAYPAISIQLWSDSELAFFGLRPSVDALLGYDPNPDRENLQLGYSLVLNKPVTPNTTVFAGVGKLGPIGEWRFENAGKDLALVFGVRLKL
jgi:hypothetical protein